MSYLLHRSMRRAARRQGDTRVVFRIYKDGDVIALFPDLADTSGVACYQHVGQHGAADYDIVIGQTKPATVDEYTPLATELKQIGYQLRIRSRR